MVTLLIGVVIVVVGKVGVGGGVVGRLAVCTTHRTNNSVTSNIILTDNVSIRIDNNQYSDVIWSHKNMLALQITNLDLSLQIQNSA